MQNKKPSVGGVWIFSGNAQFVDLFIVFISLCNVVKGTVTLILTLYICKITPHQVHAFFNAR